MDSYRMYTYMNEWAYSFERSYLFWLEAALN